MIEMRVNGFRGADVFLDEPSVTATENALVAASAATGTTVLRNAASEPHVQDLARFLIALGAEIEGVGTNTMTIQGGRALGTTSVTHSIGPDHIEVARSSGSPLSRSRS
jgi:UDP-N-acetylglucosamine 1-carboxyvinyltransferase